MHGLVEDIVRISGGKECWAGKMYASIKNRGCLASKKWAAVAVSVA